jgi:hypothetical protein
MKLVGIIGTAVLSFTLGAAAPAYAQQEEHGHQDEHAQQEDKKVHRCERATTNLTQAPAPCDKAARSGAPCACYLGRRRGRD